MRDTTRHTRPIRQIYRGTLSRSQRRPPQSSTSLPDKRRWLLDSNKFQDSRTSWATSSGHPAESHRKVTPIHGLLFPAFGQGDPGHSGNHRPDEQYGQWAQFRLFALPKSQSLHPQTIRTSRGQETRRRLPSPCPCWHIGQLTMTADNIPKRGEWIIYFPGLYWRPTSHSTRGMESYYKLKSISKLRCDRGRGLNRVFSFKRSAGGLPDLRCSLRIPSQPWRR